MPNKSPYYPGPRSYEDSDVAGARVNRGLDNEHVVNSHLRKTNSQDSLHVEHFTDTKAFDPVIFDFLAVSPEDYAKQITIDIYPVFAKITPEELTSMAWNTPQKFLKCPNIAQLASLFNRINFWCQDVILGSTLPNKRTSVLAHFIKIAKKLLDLNNLHGANAIVSALKSAAIFRLSKTFDNLGKPDRKQFDKLCELFLEQDNHKNLRDFLDKASLPCIPYLGLYQNDLVYYDALLSRTGGLHNQNLDNSRIGAVVRKIQDYQHSDYSHLKTLSHLAAYFAQHQFIEELKFFKENDFYRVSILIEPDKESSSSTIGGGVAPSDKVRSLPRNLLPPGGAATSSGSGPGPPLIPPPRSTVPTGEDLFAEEKLPPLPSSTASALHDKLSSSFNVPRSHRKTVSLGQKSSFLKYGGSSDPSSASSSPFGSSTAGGSSSKPYIERHLLDDSIMESSSQELSDSIIEEEGPDVLKAKLSDSLPQYYHSPRSKSASAAVVSGGLQYDVTTGGAVTPIKPYSAREKEKHAQLQSQLARLAFSSTSSPAASGPGAAAAAAAGLLHEDRTTAFEGCLRRKTLLKKGRRPAVNTWSRYWVELKDFPGGAYLLYYPAKNLSGTDRNSFKSEAVKLVCINRCVAGCNDPYHPETFVLTDAITGDQYKFKTESHSRAIQWSGAISHIINSSTTKAKLPDNLISFGDDPSPGPSSAGATAARRDGGGDSATVTSSSYH